MAKLLNRRQSSNVTDFRNLDPMSQLDPEMQAMVDTVARGNQRIEDVENRFARSGPLHNPNLLSALAPDQQSDAFPYLDAVSGGVPGERSRWINRGGSYSYEPSGGEWFRGRIAPTPGDNSFKPVQGSDIWPDTTIMPNVEPSFEHPSRTIVNLEDTPWGPQMVESLPPRTRWPESMERPVDMRAKKDLSRIALEGLGPNPGREANLFRREFLEQNKDDQNQRPGGGFGAPASNATIIPGKGMEPPRLTPESQEWALKNFEQSKLLIQALKDLRKGK